MQDQGDEVFVEHKIKRFFPISSRKILKRASDHLNLNIFKGLWLYKWIFFLGFSNLQSLKPLKMNQRC